MSKITKSNTKEEILTALDKALKEQDLLHNEVESLQVIVEDLGKETARKDSSITKLETLVQEEDVKKQGLIKELAAQSTNIELAKKKTEKYGEIKESLESTMAELETAKGGLLSANKKVDVLTSELESFKNRALPPNKKKGGFFKFLLKGTAMGAVVVAVIMVFVFLYNDTSKFPLSFIVHDNGITTISHNPNGCTLKSEDGEKLETSGVDVSIAKWAKEAGFDSILYGNISKVDGVVILSGANEFSTVVNMNDLVEKLDTLGYYNTLALVDNPENIVLPEPFRVTSQGVLNFYEGRRKLAGILPVFWGENKRVLYISSDNITGSISSTGIFMDDGIIKDSVSFEKPAKIEEDSSEVAEVMFGKFNEWKENVKNLW